MNQPVFKPETGIQSQVEPETGVPNEPLSPSIPDTCVGCTRISDSDSVQCLGPVFYCEHFTVIESRGFCHHPRALEIAARTRSELV